MSVLVDTTIWSLALRRDQSRLSDPERIAVAEWRRLVERGEAALLGPIRQEILSGVRLVARFEELRKMLRAFPEIELTRADFEEAAACFNACRARGISATATDLLICAVSVRTGSPIFSQDDDFAGLARHLPIRLYHVPKK